MLHVFLVRARFFQYFHKPQNSDTDYRYLTCACDPFKILSHQFQTQVTKSQVKRGTTGLDTTQSTAKANKLKPVNNKHISVLIFYLTATDRSFTISTRKASKQYTLCGFPAEVPNPKWPRYHRNGRWESYQKKSLFLFSSSSRACFLVPFVPLTCAGLYCRASLFPSKRPKRTYFCGVYVPHIYTHAR